MSSYLKAPLQEWLGYVDKEGWTPFIVREYQEEGSVYSVEAEWQIGNLYVLVTLTPNPEQTIPFVYSNALNMFTDVDDEAWFSPTKEGAELFERWLKRLLSS